LVRGVGSTRSRAIARTLPAVLALGSWWAAPAAFADRPFTDAEKGYWAYLIGLPPTPAEVQAFVADRSPRAFEKVVDRLLASPHYGEKWGRHWLDLARYAESEGFKADETRPHAWRYRD
jgi:hypothetical protein